VAQAEIAIRIVQERLRTLSKTARGDDWATLLPHVAFALNSTPSSRSGLAPFEIALGYVPRGPATPEDPAAALPISAHQSAQLHRTTFVRQALHDYNERLRSAYVAGRTPAQYKPGDFVYVHPSAGTLPTTAYVPGLASKLQTKYMGPFRVLEATDAHGQTHVALPDKSQVHPLIHVKWLKPAPAANAGMAARATANPPVEIPECITDRRVTPRGVQYLMRYRNQPHDATRWLRAHEVTDMTLITDYQARCQGLVTIEGDAARLARLQHN